MKRLSLLLLLILITAGSTFAQKIDWVNAPVNPIAFKYTKEHYNLKGDVYSYGDLVFSKEGNLIYQNSLPTKHYIYKNGKLDSDTEGQSYEFDDRGNLIKFSFAYLGIQSQSYTYNAQNLLTSASNTNGYKATYTYDDHGRVIKSEKGDDYITEYSYQKNGDQLWVTEKDISKNSALTATYIYKNGQLIGTEDKLYDIQYDALGNQIGYKRSLFYNDIEKGNNEISVVFTKPSILIDPLLECRFFVDGEKVDFIFGRAIQRKDLFIYNPFTEKYYIIKDAFNDDKSGEKQIFTEVFINSPYAFYYESSTYSALYYKGAPVQNSAYLRLGHQIMYNSWFLYVYDKGLDMTFVGDSLDLSTRNYRSLNHVAPKENIIFFKYETNLYCLLNGKPLSQLHPDYVFGKLNDDVVFTNAEGEIVYIFPGAVNIKDDQIYSGRKYNPATDNSPVVQHTPGNQTSNTNITTTTTSTVSSANNDNPYIGLSTEAATFMAVYRLTPKKTTTNLLNLHNKWVEQDFSVYEINQSYAAIFKELYAKDKDAAFNFILEIPPSYFTPNKDEILPQLTTEQRDYVRIKAQELMRQN